MILKMLNSVLPLLSTALYLTTTHGALAQNIPSLPTPVSTSSSAGNQIILNGRTLPGAWLQPKPTRTEIQTYLSDGAVKQLIGIDLLNSSNPGQQPVQWFSSSLVLNTNLRGGYRYLDITQLALKQGWKIQTNGNSLVISTPPSQLKNIRLGKLPTGDRVVLDLSMNQMNSFQYNLFHFDPTSIFVN